MKQLRLLLVALTFIVACAPSQSQTPTTAPTSDSASVDTTTATETPSGDEVVIHIEVVEQSEYISLYSVVAEGNVLRVEYFDQAETCTGLFNWETGEMITNDWVFCTMAEEGEILKADILYAELGYIEPGMLVMVCEYYPDECSNAVKVEGSFDPNLPLVEGIRVGNSLPAITLPDLFSSEVKTFENMEGMVLVNIWGAWCQYCRQEMPLLFEFAEKHPEVTIVFIGDGSEDPQDERDFLASYTLPGNAVFLHDKDYLYDNWATAYPTNYFVHDGVVTFVLVGAVNGAPGWESLLVP